jgi:hypothetical protein
MKPQLSVIKEVECHEHDMFLLWGPMNMEVPFTMVQPWKGIAGVVELGKFEFVGMKSLSASSS